MICPMLNVFSKGLTKYNYLISKIYFTQTTPSTGKGLILRVSNRHKKKSLICTDNL